MIQPLFFKHSTKMREGRIIADFYAVKTWFCASHCKQNSFHLRPKLLAAILPAVFDVKSKVKLDVFFLVHLILLQFLQQ